MTSETGGGAAFAWRTSAEGALSFRVGTFEGPLDLLLHLVRAQEIDITNLPIAELTDQYLAYLDRMRALDLEIAGEYLVMAATLVHLKSRMLLPRETSLEAPEEEDPRAALVQQLLEYQRYKQAAENLQALDTARSLVWTRPGDAALLRGERRLVVDLVELVAALREVLERLGEERRLSLRRDHVSVERKMAWLRRELAARESVELAELLELQPTRLDRIGVFLALLELVRLGEVVAFQRRLFEPIRLARVRLGPEVGP